MWIFFRIIECKFLVWIYWSVLKSDYLSLFSSSSLFCSFKCVRVDLFWFESVFHWLLKIWVCFPLVIELSSAESVSIWLSHGSPDVKLMKTKWGVYKLKKKVKKSTLKPLLKGKSYLATVEIKVVCFFLCILFLTGNTFESFIIFESGRRWVTNSMVLGFKNLNIDTYLYLGNAQYFYKTYRNSQLLTNGLCWR